MTVQRTGASRHAEWRCGHRRWLAPVADLPHWPEQMRELLLIALAAFGLVGCKSISETRPVAHDVFRMKAVYQVLNSEPTPVPQQTLYDGDTRQHEAFNEGYRNGWQRAISGDLLKGTFGTPIDLAKDLLEPWTAGWEAGAKVGFERWLAERTRQLEANGQPDGPANGSQPIRSQTNSTSSVAGSRR